ncbi:MAG: branched-chain amino acid ABC transporter permease [Paracoccaceae bacterium]
MRDQSIPKLRRLLFWAVPLLLLPLPLATNAYTQFIVNGMLIATLVTLGFSLVIGNLGQLAFANTAFFGIGAYASAILTATFGLPWIVTVPLAGLIGGLGGFLASSAALRGIRAYYLAIITLAFGEMMRWVYVHADAVTGGTNGLPMPRDNSRLLADRRQGEVLHLPCHCRVADKGTSNLLRSRLGRAIMAVRENEVATASLGIPTARVIVITFVWSGFVVGCAGALFARHVGHVFPESFGMLHLIASFAMVLVGGLGSVLGAVLGAVILTALPEYLRAFPGLEELFFGLIVGGVLLGMPMGLASLLRRVSPLFSERFYRE